MGVVCVEGQVCACLERMCVQHVKKKISLTRGREEAGRMCCELMCDRVISIGTQFSNLYTAVDTPARAA